MLRSFLQHFLTALEAAFCLQNNYSCLLLHPFWFFLFLICFFDAEVFLAALFTKPWGFFCFLLTRVLFECFMWIWVSSGSKTLVLDVNIASWAFCEPLLFVFFFLFAFAFLSFFNQFRNFNWPETAVSGDKTTVYIEVVLHDGSFLHKLL